ncbi:Thioesterase superfamily [Penicillium atrosanguineum]|uniref:Thioesterase superfamily n=1 Tax=Penicillium atrosanguineum TaxID=1132637 RepID=UPI0023A73CDF|nr:Thioesterase superfamily [Penicillium atrosanguineum]KAJ5305384.1 Thioesterase superfamily [Penicillium atrosanguineum]
MIRSLVLAAAALTGLVSGLPVSEATPFERDFCLLEDLVIDILKLDSKADTFCTSVLNIKTATNTVTTTSTPAVATATATAYTTGTVTTTTTATITDTISDYFTATEVDYLTTPVTDIVDVTNTVSTTITIDQTETDTATDYFTAIITDTVSDTVTSTATAVSTVIVYDRRDIQERGQAVATPACLQGLGNAFASGVCSCLHLTTPTVTATSTVVAATPTVTVTITLPVTATEIDTVTATAYSTTDITDTETVTSTVPSTVYMSSFFTDVESSSVTDYFTVTATVDSTVTETATVTTDIDVYTTVQAVATATQVCTTLAIEKFILANTDQTTVAKANLYSGSNIVINTNNLYGPFTNPFPSTDSWYGSVPSLSMLFTCDAEQRIFISYKGDGTFTVVPGHLASSPLTYAVSATTPPSGSTITIYAVVWGIGLITDSSVISALYTAHITGTQFEWSNTFFGKDTWVNYKKTGAIYYTDATGTLQVIYGKESTYSTL